MTKTTIHDIAKQMDMSVTTVCRALQNSPIIKQDTLVRVHDLAKRLGYQSNHSAKNLKENGAQPVTIGVIIPKLESYLMSSIFSGIESVASNLGFNLMVSQSFGSAGQEMANLTALHNCKIDGLLVSLSNENTEMKYFDFFLEKGIPIVFFDRVPTQDHYTKVAIDNQKAAKEATSHLINQGCKRIVHVTSKSKESVFAKRLHGYKDALACAGIPVNEDLILYNDFSNSQSGNKVANQILGMAELPDGIFAADDECAVSCMINLKNVGVRIPEDIAIVGFNNNLSTQIVEPNVTTVNYPGRQVGERAMRYLADALNNESGKTPILTAFLRSELIVRESSLRQVAVRTS